MYVRILQDGAINTTARADQRVNVVGGQLMEVHQNVGERLVSEGLAVPAVAPQIAGPPGLDTAPPLATGSMPMPHASASERDAQVMEAMLTMAEDKAGLNADGKPNVNTLSDRVGWEVSGADRDRLWAALEPAGDGA